MTCEEVRKITAAGPEGKAPWEVSTATVAAVMTHLHGCEKCKAEIRAAARTQLPKFMELTEGEREAVRLAAYGSVVKALDDPEGIPGQIKKDIRDPRRL